MTRVPFRGGASSKSVSGMPNGSQVSVSALIAATSPDLVGELVGGGHGTPDQLGDDMADGQAAQRGPRAQALGEFAPVGRPTPVPAGPRPVPPVLRSFVLRYSCAGVTRT